MANAIYPKAKEAFLQGSIDLTTDTIKFILVDTADYTYSTTHQYLSDVAAAGRVATSGALASKTITNGIFDAADVTLSSVSGDQSEALIFYKDTGVEGTSPLLWYIDTGVTGLPVTPNGNDINVIWNASGIIAPMGT